MQPARIWDRHLSERDRRVFEASGMGTPQGWGARPALAVIDVAYGWTGDRREPILESIRRFPFSCGEAAYDALDHIERLLAAARAARIPIVYTTLLAPQTTAAQGRWTEKFGRFDAANRSAEHQFALHERIAPHSGDIVIYKPKPSAFFETSLTSTLIDLGVDQLIVCGTTTSGCVRATVTDAFSLSYRVAVVEEATFDRSEVSHAISLLDMHMKFADVVSLDDAVSYIDRSASADATRKAAS